MDGLLFLPTKAQSMIGKHTGAGELGASPAEQTQDGASSTCGCCQPDERAGVGSLGGRRWLHRAVCAAGSSRCWWTGTASVSLSLELMVL